MTKRKAKTAAQVAVTIMIMAMVGCMMLSTWSDHPGEQPVSGIEYMEAISR